MGLQEETIDYYELLGLSEDAQDADIHRAWRKTSLKYHPDKNPDDPHAADKFHLLQVAYNALTDTTMRQAYDAERLAKLARQRREEAFDLNRKTMAEKLREREDGFHFFEKQKDQENNRLREKLRSLQEQSARLRRDREERLFQDKDSNKRKRETSPVKTRSISDLDRSVKVRWKKKYVDQVDESFLRSFYSKFGQINDVIIQKTVNDDKKYVYAILVFDTLDAAYSAVTVESPSVIKDTQWLKPLSERAEFEEKKPKSTMDYEELTMLRMKQKQREREQERKATMAET
ncbi:DNAJ domain-containing protein Cwf23 [Schizosaccharomyces cryophilus OY26]|uniref:DNAJ domain-containing protein Cwf23 n=1 Tax=Schizosaccharomyces cryophilus (strain OY26 / ATCC MYA-4695 / CBS 11777 / NBRC 106824 / NRRL Y48691) TaxID=653667 RepID=S9WZ12_SCHCR|nr:DNAJ domain-containing protein Cwf23 [Schizosaccharomyces cryophilus OY26]EPY49937.1 DNAJ domain-containing protein Cwf23 [Schizosaccharomyces cryophilus OY26]